MGVYFSQTSVIWFFLGFSCCPFYRGVRYSEVSARRELTVCERLFIKLDAEVEKVFWRLKYWFSTRIWGSIFPVFLDFDQNVTRQTSV